MNIYITVMSARNLSGKCEYIKTAKLSLNICSFVGVISTFVIVCLWARTKMLKFSVKNLQSIKKTRANAYNKIEMAKKCSKSWNTRTIYRMWYLEKDYVQCTRVCSEQPEAVVCKYFCNTFCLKFSINFWCFTIEYTSSIWTALGNACQSRSNRNTAGCWMNDITSRIELNT